MFYEYHQSRIDEYHINDKVCSHMMIEADSHHEANQIMVELGVVFEEDCGYEVSECRWYKAYAFVEFPSCWDNDLVFENVEDYCNYLFERYTNIATHRTSPHSRIYFKSGKVKEIGKI